MSLPKKRKPESRKSSQFVKKTNTKTKNGFEYKFISKKDKKKINLSGSQLSSAKLQQINKFRKKRHQKGKRSDYRTS